MTLDYATNKLFDCQKAESRHISVDPIELGPEPEVTYGQIFDITRCSFWFNVANIWLDQGTAKKYFLTFVPCGVALTW